MSEETPKYGVTAICDAPREQVGGGHYKRMKIDVFEFAEEGNKSAGVRARKATLALEKLFKQFRKESVK